MTASPASHRPRTTSPHASGCSVAPPDCDAATARPRRAMGPPMMLRLLTLSLFSAGLGAGCTLALSDATVVENSCGHDSECHGATCDLDTGMCVSTNADALRVAVEVVPASDPLGGTPVPGLFGPFDVYGSENIDLETPASITVVGQVRWDGEEEPLTAEVTFRRLPDIAGAPEARITTRTLPEPITALDSQPADYAVRVTADQRYDVIVEPTGNSVRELPPIRLMDVPVPGGGDVWRLDVDYQSAHMPTVSGLIVDKSTDEGVGQDGLLVHAIDLETGRVVSSTATTGADAPGTGGFELRLDAQAGPYLLRISGGPERPLFPTFTVDPAYFFPNQDGLLRILVPTLRHVSYIGLVEAEIDAEQTMRVPNATITLRSEDIFDESTGVTGSFRVTATTGIEDCAGGGVGCGQFAVEVLPGTYEVIVTASGIEDVGVLATTLRIEAREGDDPIMGQLFTLPLRTRVDGTVRTTNMRVMPGATVQAAALGGAPPSGLPPAARFNRSSESVTDGDGRFDLRLDAGAYDLFIKPPSDSGFAWIVSRSLVIGGASEHGFSQPFEFAAPVPVKGTTWTPEGTPMAGAEVRAYGIVDDNGAERFIPIGRTVSGPDGSYSLLLPPRL